jgi:hypothetical protein
MNKYEIYIAIFVQLLVTIPMFYIDAKNTIEPVWKNVLRFGLNPIVLVIYQFAGEQFWYATVIHSVIFQVAYIGSSYLATRQSPSPRNWVSLGLGFVAVLVSAI